MISPQYFANISVQISPNNKKLDIFKIYTKGAVEKCPRWNFQAYRKPRNSKNKSVYNIVGHPVCHDVTCHDVICCDVTCHDVMCHDVICHYIICHVVLCHDVICHDVISHDVICHDVLCHGVICHSVICHDIMTSYVMMSYVGAKLNRIIRSNTDL